LILGFRLSGVTGAGSRAAARWSARRGRRRRGSVRRRPLGSPRRRRPWQAAV